MEANKQYFNKVNFPRLIFPFFGMMLGGLEEPKGRGMRKACIS